MGVRHTSSNSLVNLCDDYFYYDDMASSAMKLAEAEVADLLQRSINQLLQNEKSVPASLLKQRMQALSKGTFNRSPMGKQSFNKFLGGFTDIVKTYQEGTTLFVCSPSTVVGNETVISNKPLSKEDVSMLLEKAMTQLVKVDEKVQASLLKQYIQELSGGAFDENKQGIKSFRKFLEHHHQIVQVEQEGTTLYVRRTSSSKGSAQSAKPLTPVSLEEAEKLLAAALSKLVTEEQSRVRASLLKQEMQNLSEQVFSETALGFENFRDFLAKFPATAAFQQKGTTLYVFPPEQEPEPVPLHLQYRSELKKRGLRVIPSDIRLSVIKGRRRGPGASRGPRRVHRRRRRGTGVARAGRSVEAAGGPAGASRDASGNGRPPA
jgi:hypothetical protein